MMPELDKATIQDVKNRADLVQEIGKVVTLRKVGSVYRGPCPWCGGSPRATKFVVMPARQWYQCHHCGENGDVITFIRDQHGCDFDRAIEILGGPRKLTVKERRKMERRAEREEKADKKRLSQRITKAREIWNDCEPAEGSLVEDYLRFRKIQPEILVSGFPKSIKYHPNLPYWHTPNAASPYILHRGAAMVAAIVSSSNALIGVHCTWLAPKGRGKAKLKDQSGFVLKSKKVKGVMKGGAIRLTARSHRMIVGEGIETTLSALLALNSAGYSDYSAWCAVSLGNIAGRSLGSMPHPKLPDRRIPSRNPDLESPGFLPPTTAREILFLGDSDSDRPTTENQLYCAAARVRQNGANARIRFADSGRDFNDMLMRAG